MKKIPRSLDENSIFLKKPLIQRPGSIGFVLSGGGARAAYQIGALKALIPYLEKSTIKVIVGSSIGAINGLLLAACLKEGIGVAVSEVENLWRERTFKNTFSGSPSGAFFRAIKVAVMQYLSPGPSSYDESIFDPSPLMQRVDGTIRAHGGLAPNNRISTLESVGVMTTVEGKKRHPLLFVSSHKKIPDEIMEGATFDICYVDELYAKHGFASAALPAVLPPVELDTEHGTVRLVDGGISQNVPVDPAARLGADRVVVVDISGRDWWLDRFNEALDTRPTWEVPAEEKTFCVRPPDTFVVRCQRPLGDLLKHAVSGKTSKFIAAVGPTWPIYTLLKKKFGEDVAYETLSYVALDPDYISALIERGYNETLSLLRNRPEPEFEHMKSYSDLVQQVFK